MIKPNGEHSTSRINPVQSSPRQTRSGVTFLLIIYFIPPVMFSSCLTHHVVHKSLNSFCIVFIFFFPEVNFLYFLVFLSFLCVQIIDYGAVGWMIHNGFSPEEAVVALQSSFGDPRRAIDNLHFERQRNNGDGNVRQTGAFSYLKLFSCSPPLSSFY